MIKSSDVFILSSLYEGLPNVLLESQVLKKFIISSNCPTGPREILLNGKGGDLIDIGDYKALSQKIIRYSKKNNKIRDQIRKKINLGYQNLDRFDYNFNMKKYHNLIKKYYTSEKNN